MAARLLALWLVFCLTLAACQPLPDEALGSTTRLPEPSLTPFGLAHLYNQLVATYTPTAAPSSTPMPPPAFGEQQIPLHFFCALSGPLAESSHGRLAAFEAAVAAHNAAGGHQGANLAVHVTDTGVANPAAAAQQALEQHPASLAVLCDASSEAALLQLLTQRGLPAISLGAFTPPRGTLYALQPAPDLAMGHFLRYLHEHWDSARPLGAGGLATSQARLALLTWPTPLAGQANTPAVLAYAEELGIELVLQAELTPQLDLNVYDHLYAARDANANVLYVQADSYGLAYVLNALGHLGLRSRFVVAAPPEAYEPALYSYLADPRFAQGLYFVSALQPGEEWEAAHMQAALDLAVAALDEALRQASEPAAITRPQVLAALQELGYASGLRAPAQLAVWQVGADAADLQPPEGLRPLPELAP